MFGSKDDFKRDYDLQAQSYDRHREQTRDGAWLREEEARFVADRLALSAGGRLLEAGCGTGRILLPLARKGYDCYGIDPSQKMLEVLEQKRPAEVRVRIAVGDIEALPFADRAFDGVYTVNVLQWLPGGYARSFAELCRVTKPGGRIVMDFPNAHSLLRRLKRLFCGSREKHRLFSHRELVEFFAACPEVHFQLVGKFSYPQILFRYQMVGRLAALLEKLLPLPTTLRSKYFIVATKVSGDGRA